jgi:Peptidase family S41
VPIRKIAVAQRGVALAAAPARRSTRRKAAPFTSLFTRAERLRLVDGIECVIDGVFTHLPLKRARYGFDPVQRLRILRSQVDELSDDAFHHALAGIITRLRDAHTRYTGPETLADKVAALPFLVDMLGSAAAPEYVVTKVGAGLGAQFVAGVKLEYWNGVPIDRAVQIYSDREVGGRPDSERANAVLTLTLRSLQYGPPPDEHWVVIGYRSVTATGAPMGPIREITIPWRVIDPGDIDAMQDGTGIAKRKSATRKNIPKALRRARAVNPASEAVRRAKMLLFAPKSLTAKAKVNARGTTKRRGPKAALGEIATTLEQTLRIRVLDAPGGPFAHLRIWAFNAEPDDFINELLRVIPLLPTNGCILDIRGNPGGYIWAAEKALQLFTPMTIQPTRFSVLATPFTRAMAAVPALREEMAPWRESLGAAVRNGELYSQPIPITDPADCNSLGQHYSGPVVLIGDATTYSAGDLFAAGFVDNGLGPFICAGSATGAGGANVWDYDELRGALKGTPIALPLLPGGVGLSLSFRRATRAAASEGLPIEDVGIAGTPYAMTRDDVLAGNRDLLKHCIALLRQQPVSRLSVQHNQASRTVTVATQGLDRLDVELDGHPNSTQLLGVTATTTIAYPARTRVVEVTGFVGDEVRQRRRVVLRGG